MNLRYLQLETHCMSYHRWIRKQDLYFCSKNRHITLTLDKVSGHKILYQPTNIELIFCEPNLTPYMQSLDAGIIHCVKAHYRREFCLQAVDMDEAGQDDIYKINLLKLILMARQVWNAVTPETIQNCWRHMKITQ